MHMHLAELRAAMQRGEDFSGIEQMLCVKSAFDPDLLGEVSLRKHFWHQIAFLDADAMFARQHTADCNA